MAEFSYATAIFRSSRRVWGLALLEVAVICIVSLLPLLGAAFRELLPATSHVSVAKAFSDAFLSGQLLFYALGLTATIVWQSNKDWGDFFPFRIIFNLYSIAAVSISALVIGYNPTLADMNAGLISPFSVFLFVLSMVLYVLMSMMAEARVNVRKVLSQGDEALAQQVRQSRGEQ